ACSARFAEAPIPNRCGRQNRGTVIGLRDICGAVPDAVCALNPRAIVKTNASPVSASGIVRRHLNQGRRIGADERLIGGENAEAIRDIWSLDRIGRELRGEDRKSTRLNSSHLGISYAVFCLKKKK